MRRMIDLKNFKSGDNYSSEEMEIGKWLDGKTIYRIVGNLSFTTISGGVYNKVGDLPQGISNVISLKGVVYNTSTKRYEALPSSDYSLQVRDNGFGFLAFNSSNIKKDFIIIVEYTK